MVVAILAYKGEPLRKKTLRAAGLPETVHIVRLFPQLKETAGPKAPPHLNRNPTNPGSGGSEEVRFEPKTCQTRGEAFWPR